MCTAPKNAFFSLQPQSEPAPFACTDDRVINDECAFSFDTPFSPDGVYVSLTSYQAFGKHFVRLDRERKGTKLYVHIKHTRVPKPAGAEEEATAPTKLGIGVAGGFALAFNRTRAAFDPADAARFLFYPLVTHSTHGSIDTELVAFGEDAVRYRAVSTVHYPPSRL